MGEVMVKCKVVYYTIVRKDESPVYSDGEETNKARYILEWMLNHLGYFELPKIYVSEHGKPYFRDSDICFNYSHSKSYIACAVSCYDVGVDIEDASRKISDGVSKKYLDEEGDNNKRLEKWVKKEAYSKLKGLGLKIIKDIHLQNIYDKNIFICNENYMCSIYSGSYNVMFKEIEFK